MGDTINQENTSTTTSPNPNPEEVDSRKKVESDTFQQMLDVLDSLLSHNHTFTDNYGSACQCKCKCKCNGRGTL